jgi:hypothetical protein
MATNKYEIRACLERLIPEDSPFQGLSRSEIFETKPSIPENGFDWLQCLAVLRNSAVRSYRPQCHTLIDGRQFLEMLAPGGPSDSDGIPVESTYMPRWQDLATAFCKKQLSISEETQRAGTLHFSMTRTVLAFDNGRGVSRAKRPTQTKRRHDLLKGLDRKKQILQLPSDPTEECPSLKGYDYVPPNWREVSHVWGAYQESIIDLLNETIARTISYPQGSTKEYCIWNNGIMTATQREKPPTRLEEATKEFEAIGEYDHFIVRYIVWTVSTELEKCREAFGLEKDAKPSIVFEREVMSDLRHLVFRLYTSDTDILLFALWTLEHLKTALELEDVHLPQIFMVALRKPYRKTNITSLFLALRHKLCSGRVTSESSFEIRSLCTAFFCWGNDFLPSLYYLTPKDFSETYFLLRPLIRTTLVGPSRESFYAYPEASLLNGGTVRMYTMLVYAYKYMLAFRGASTPEKTENLQRKVADFCREYASVPVHVLEGTIRKHVKNLQPEKHPCSKRTVMARIGAVATVIHCIDHALKTVPGYDESVVKAGLPLQSYCNTYQDKLDNLSSKVIHASTAVGILSQERCTEWTLALNPPKPSQSRVLVPDTEKTLEETAARIIRWHGEQTGDHHVPRHMRASSSSSFAETDFDESRLCSTLHSSK